MFAETRNEEFWQNQIIQNDLILRSVAEGVCVVDINNKITYLNSSAAKMFGSEDSDIIGQNYSTILYGYDKEFENPICPIRFALTEGTTSHVNTETFFRSDGTDFLVEFICVPLIANKQIIGVVITFQDVTERREIEAAIARARDVALEAANTKAAFLANMSHEIRTPLNGIIGTTHLLLESDLNKEQLNLAQMLKTSADLLLHTVNDILDFSKIEAGKRELEIINFDLHQLIENKIGFFSTLARNKNIKIYCEIEENVPAVLQGDSNQLSQILNNLIGNALKFTEKGEISLRISFEKEDKNGVMLLFTVSDSGIGIDETAQKKLFQPFAQADISTTRNFGGTGLGLAICKKIVELMKGKIGVESCLGKGSRFWFTAVFQVQNSKKDLPENPKFKIRNLKSEERKLNILTVEDNPINRELTIKILEQIGYSTETAENGLEAVKAANQKKYDLILMDCQMPELDGFQAAKEIRKQAKDSKSPKIIALTAGASIGEREKCLEAGMEDYLSKPITIKQLEDCIGKHFYPKNINKSLDLQPNLIQHRFANIIDANTLENFLEIESKGEKNFVVEMLNIFCVHTEKQLGEIENDLQNYDAKGIIQKAHSLAGSSANIGISRLSKLFEYLEIMANEQDWVQIPIYLNDILLQFSIIKREIYEE